MSDLKIYESGLAVGVCWVLAQAVPTVTHAQHCDFAHPVSVAAPGYRVVELPVEALAYGGDRQSVGSDAFRQNPPGYPPSLRVLGRTADGDTLQMPFVTTTEAVLPLSRSLVPSNLGRVGAATRFTVEIPDRPQIDRLHLILDNQNFEGRVTLEASDRPGDWQTLLTDARILDISQGIADYAYTTLRFAAVRFTYYRITVSGIPDFSISEVRAAEAGRADQLRRRHAATVTTLPRVSKTNQTQLLIALPEARLVDRVTVYASSEVPFERPVQVSVVADTAFAGDGRLRYRTIASGASVLARGETPQPNTFAESVTALLVATIYDGDDRPLEVDSVVVEGPRRFVTVRFDAAAAYWLGYGCGDLGLPDYDLARQRELIPAGLDTLGVAPQEVYVRAVAGPEVFEDVPPYLLWGVLAVAGVVIVGVALRLLRAK